MIEFKSDMHTFGIEREGYLSKNVKVNVSQYSTSAKAILETLQKGYTLTEKVRYEDGTPVKNSHFFEQGTRVTADAYSSKLYVKPIYARPKTETVLPV